MLRTVDRYVIREVIAPFTIVLIVFTFMLLMAPIMDVADQLIAKGVSWDIILRILPTLLPQALALTVPMSLLVGLLIAFGRLSEDREWVALQACGVSVYRLVRPVAVLAVLGCLVTFYVMLYALPDANQAYNEILYPVLWSKADSKIKPRVFYQQISRKVLYMRDITRDGTWKDVFLCDESRDNTVYVARRGRLIVDRDKRTAQIALEDVTQHMSPPTDDPASYKYNQAKTVLLPLDAEEIFPRQKINKGYNQETIAELQADIESLQSRNIPAIEEPMAIHQKFSIPVACLVFAAIGLALGVSSRRDGKMASFVLGISVIFVYYVLMYGAQAAAKAMLIPAWSARWVPNVVLGPLGLVLLIWRARYSEREIQIPWLARRRPTGEAEAEAEAAAAVPRTRGRVRVTRRVSERWLPRPRILDWYISKLYLKILAFTFGALLLIFYIAEFIDLSDKVFKGTAKPGMIALYYVYKTPYFAYFIIPIAGLIATLVTLGLLTRNSELIVMKACGISIYRSAVPILLFAVLAGGTLFFLEENVLATANRRWKAYKLVFQQQPSSADTMNRGWVVSRDGNAIYHFGDFQMEQPGGRSGRRDLLQLSIYRFDRNAWRLAARSFLARASYSASRSAQEASSIWVAHNGWTRQFPADPKAPVSYETFARRDIALEPPSYFGNEQPDAERMNYFDLRRYVDALRASGFNTTKWAVDLQRKIAFPFVALVMALIAVPFAVTMGRRGAMYGIGLGVVLAIGYWVTMQVFAAFGTGGVLTPALAAWAPNILFSCGAAYLLLTVRT